MPNPNPHEIRSGQPSEEEKRPGKENEEQQAGARGETQREHYSEQLQPDSQGEQPHHRTGARGTAAMDPGTRQEVARKGGLAVSRNKQHMADIGRKGGQSVSKNREHMAEIGRKGGAASRGTRGGSGQSGGSSGSGQSGQA